MTGRRARNCRSAAASAAVACAVLLGAGTAQANSPIVSFSAVPSSAQAGGHPDVGVQFTTENRVTQKSQSTCNCEDPKDATVHLPAGFIGDPHATPRCTIGEFSADECPLDSQVGIVEVTIGFFGSQLQFSSAVYNISPPPDVAGLLGFKLVLFDTPQFTLLAPRTDSDYGLDATATSIFHIYPLVSFKQVLWGVPADPSHDPLRFDPNLNPGGFKGFSWILDSLCNADGSKSTDDPSTVVKPCSWPIPPSPSNSLRTPFLQNPGRCEAAVPISLDVLSYDGGTSHADSTWPEMIGCDQLSFNPSLFAQPTDKATDSPSGIDVNLTVPQESSPTIPSPSELRGATVTLPAGFSINPSAADGKTACSELSASFGSTLAGSCPEFSKVGSLTIESSGLPGPLPGFVYLGQPLPGNPYRIFLVADGFGVHLKFPGDVEADARTGQLTIHFENLPESPLTAFKMHFFGSERGLLATPTSCGTFPVTSTFSPWDSALGSQTSSQFFSLDSGPGGSACPGGPRPFAPQFDAASTSHNPGAHAPLWVDLKRRDGDQNLSGLTVSAAPGFSAKLAGVAYCPEASLARLADASSSGLSEQASPSCPTASLIGSSIAGAGAGTHPLYLNGKVYLAGPYKGAPLSLAVVTPAVSGPYDLGNVLVRAALRIDPSDAHITAVSDPLPQIIGGIPLRLRSIRVTLDRPDFALNPTSCDPFAVQAIVQGEEGGTEKLAQRFQVANCRSLPFGPKLALRLSGPTKRAANPTLHATLSAEPGSANIASTSVTLPHSMFIDNAHLSNPCTRVQFAADRCPPDSAIGFARAVTPLLDKPLEGHVYLRSAPDSKSGLPDLVAALRGQIDIDLVGHNDSLNGGQLRTTFANVPDTPVSSFRLDLEGGRHGILESSESLCAKAQIAKTRFGGQNGKVVKATTKMRTPCGGRKSSHRNRRGAGR